MKASSVEVSTSRLHGRDPSTMRQNTQSPGAVAGPVSHRVQPGPGSTCWCLRSPAGRAHLLACDGEGHDGQGVARDRGSRWFRGWLMRSRHWLPHGARCPTTGRVVRVGRWSEQTVVACVVVLLALGACSGSALKFCAVCGPGNVSPSTTGERGPFPPGTFTAPPGEEQDCGEYTRTSRRASAQWIRSSRSTPASSRRSRAVLPRSWSSTTAPLKVIRFDGSTGW